MKINLRDTGTEIGFACARVLALSSFSLISSLIVSGSVAVAGGFPLIEAPAHRVAKMSAILIGASAAGCILGAWMTGAIGKNDDEKLTEIVTNELAITKDEVAELRSQLREAEMRRIDAIDTRDKEIWHRGDLLREGRQQLKERDKQLEAWEEWLDLTNQLDERYEVFGCKGYREVYLGTNKPRVKEIGERLNSSGGYNLMLWAAKQIPLHDQRELECAWHGIGQWES